MIDYDEAYDYALDFCNPRREKMAKPYYSDGTLYATNGHVALAIHHVERPLDEEKSGYAEQIKCVFKMVHDQKSDGLLRSVEVPKIIEAFRSVLSRIAEAGNAYVCKQFDLSQGDIQLADGVCVCALYAQMAFAMSDSFEIGEHVRVYVSVPEKPVLFEGKSWEVVVMPKRADHDRIWIDPRADAVTGKLINKGDE